jgi:hypothetical protein
MSTFALSILTVAAIAAMCLFAGCASTRTAEGVSMSAVSTGYICPLTGEELPCPDCCPLNQEQAEEQAAKSQAAESADGYECPLTGEILPCPRCYPLNQN